MTFISYAQNFEDVMLWRVFRDLGDGFYIDVGAAHPDIDSVTRAFYDRGWRGINIEPVAELHARLQAARPRDLNLRAAAGEFDGEGLIHAIAGTGLSTMDASLAARHRDAALDVRVESVPVVTIARTWRAHAPETVHFLKIDVEGSESAALAGADLETLRPWIVLVEATAPGATSQTHAEWEPALLRAGYRFLWFDGLNRFYAATERAAAIAPHFQTPVCVFDDFLRAADTEWTRRITEIEASLAHARAQCGELLEHCLTADSAASAADRRAAEADMRAHGSDQRAAGAEDRALRAEQRSLRAEQRADDVERRTAGQLAAEAGKLAAAQQEALRLRASTSWRITAPLRRAVDASRALGLRAPAGWAQDADARPEPAKTQRAPKPAAGAASVLSSAPARPLRSVHQFHSGSAIGDAITNAMLLIRDQLRLMGYVSEIYVEHRDPALAAELRELGEMPPDDRHVLILHHSMGYDAFARILATPASKVLVYHNITPVELFDGHPEIQRYIRLGHDQLAAMRGRVAAALADSEFNAIELRRLGFDDPRACTLLFDLDALSRRRVASPRRKTSDPFTVLFVGRIVPSKGQLDLVEAFARFRQLHARPSRLVLVGRAGGLGQGYADAIRARAEALGLAGQVLLTDLISDEELTRYYRQADLFVSLSLHEGFGVPLIEAAAAGVPVLAWPAGAVGYTMESGPGLLRTRDPDGVAARMAEVASDPSALASLARDQRAAAARFDLPLQLAVLGQALVQAGAAPASDPRTRAALARNLRFTVVGHVNKTYSLAAVNRAMARALDHARPGRVRLIPVEGSPTDRLEEVPDDDRAKVADLAARPPHDSGPVVVISQHYPVHVPPDRGDCLLAFVFWEESRLPDEIVATLNNAFQGVLAPSSFVAKTLVDSGVSVPVRIVGCAPPEAAPGARQGRRLDPPASFTFLHISSAFPRKGLDVLLSAFARAFRASDNVRLIVKTFPNPHNDAAKLIAALRAADPDAPAIEHIDGDLDLEAMTSLFEAADAAVLPTRGEGYNLVAAEAMASGVPLIVTGHGGHMDFCDATNARLLAFRLARSGSHLAAAASLWAEPDADDLVGALREAMDEKKAADRAARARASIRRHMSADDFVERVEAAALDVMLRPSPAPMRLCVVSTWGVRCGVAEYARALIDAMSEAEAGLEVVVAADVRAGQARVERPGLRLRPVWTLGSAQTATVLRQFMADERPDAVHIQHQPGLMGWAVLGDALAGLADPRRVTAVTLHNTAHLLEVDDAEREAALAGLASASRVIVHTLADLERLRSLGLCENAVLIPQGAPEPPAVSRERTLGPRDVVTIGACGFLLPGKGFPTLVEAAGLLRPQWPRLRVRLVTADYGVQASRTEAAAVRDAAKAAGMGDAVQLVTEFLPMEEARRLIAECDVAVLPYPGSKEGSSAALRMALSAGPCVAVTPIGLFAEAEDAVYMLPGCSARAIADGLRQLLGDSALRSRHGDAARAWMGQRNWRATGARTVGMLKGLSVSAEQSAY